MRLISDEKAKDMIKNHRSDFTTEYDYRTARACINAVPSAQPERDKGEWNTCYHNDIEFLYACDQCGYSAPYQMIGSVVFLKKWNFCPNCGADMRGEQE